MTKEETETVVWISRNPKEEKIYNPHTVGVGRVKEGCECCSILFGAFSLTGLVAVFILKKGFDNGSR